jgi:polar amino acid transport system substrate-binding protein
VFKKLLFFGLCFFSSLLCASSDKIVVGTNAEFPPFTYIDKGVIVGFDIDVAKEVARKLGKEIQWKDMPFDALIPEIILAQVDFVAAGMSYTEERAKRVSFTKSYLSGDPLVIFSKQEMSLVSLKGKTVVVVEGFTADLFMSQQKGINLIRLPTQSDAFLAIKNGRADAFVTAKTTVSAFAETQRGSHFQTTSIEGTAETCAIVVPKNKPQMLDSVQKALDEMEKDGTMMQLKKKWNL